MINLEQIKINLYAKMRRRLGLQALLTTLRVKITTQLSQFTTANWWFGVMFQ